MDDLTYWKEQAQEEQKRQKEQEEQRKWNLQLAGGRQLDESIETDD